MASLQTAASQTQYSERQHARDHENKLLTGFRGFWGRWGFQIKIMIGLLFPVMIEVGAFNTASMQQ